MKKTTDSKTIPISGIDKVYVLSVKTFSERIQHITKELRKHQIPFEFIFEYDANELTKEDLSLFSPSNMKTSHKSLVLKNIATWRKIVDENIKRALILEDDAILSENFRDDLEKIIDATEQLNDGYLIFLGGADTKLPLNFLDHPLPLVPRRMTTADGFIIDHRIAKERLRWLKNNRIAMPADGLMAKIDSDLELPHYWPKTAIVQQASCTGQFKTTLDNSRSKHSLLYIKLRYKWHKFKNQTVKRILNGIKK